MPQRYSARGALNLPGPPGRPGHPQVWHPDFDSRQNKVPLHLQVFLFPNAMRHRAVSRFVKPRAVRFQRYRSHRIRLRGVCLFFLGRLTDWLVVRVARHVCKGEGGWESTSYLLAARDCSGPSCGGHAGMHLTVSCSLKSRHTASVRTTQNTAKIRTTDS
jgi:hypothetical protein